MLLGVNPHPHEVADTAFKREAVEKLHTCYIAAVNFPVEFSDAALTRVGDLLCLKSKTQRHLHCSVSTRHTALHRFHCYVRVTFAKAAKCCIATLFLGNEKGVFKAALTHKDSLPVIQRCGGWSIDMCVGVGF